MVSGILNIGFKYQSRDVMGIYYIVYTIVYTIYIYKFNVQNGIKKLKYLFQISKS